MRTVFLHIGNEGCHGIGIFQIKSVSGGEKIKKIRIAAVETPGDITQLLSSLEADVFRLELIPFAGDVFLLLNQRIGIKVLKFGTFKSVEGRQGCAQCD